MEVNGTLNSTFIGSWTREQAVTLVSFVYVIVSILMVVLCSSSPALIFIYTTTALPHIRKSQPAGRMERWRASMDSRRQSFPRAATHEESV
ncbi:hypothetical protein Q1695_008501 [Nippostrongylus brasiliensis]|nr:hypothetical protein Q1695_008501 [Nippostrongylus brasiliensis]